MVLCLLGPLHTPANGICKSSYRGLSDWGRRGLPPATYGVHWSTCTVLNESGLPFQSPRHAQTISEHCRWLLGIPHLPRQRNAMEGLSHSIGHPASGFRGLGSPASINPRSILNQNHPQSILNHPDPDGLTDLKVLFSILHQLSRPSPLALHAKRKPGMDIVPRNSEKQSGSRTRPTFLYF